MKDDDIQCQCRCGNIWSMDYDPTPSSCENDPWRLRLGDDGDWGPWVDRYGDRI